jgi:hypothetical protein
MTAAAVRAKSSTSVPLEWRAREPPLPPCAVAARGKAARALAARLLARGDEALAELRGAAGDGLLLILGPAEALPWADGAEYLGRDERAPSLLLPTAEEPAAHPGLLERALLAHFPGALPPLAVLRAPALVLPASAARPISRALLAAWLARAAC